MLRSLYPLISCLLLVSCAGHERITGQPTTGLDRKLTTFSYIEDGGLVTFIVNTKATRYRDAAGYMPIEIAVANRGLKNLTLTRESFSLIDADKTRYPLASPGELIEGYEFLDFDRNSLAELEGIVQDKFATYTRYNSRFSPTRMATRNRRSNLVRDVVALPRFGYVVDMLYFPRPTGGILNQRFDLFLQSPDLEDPVFVKFEVR